MELKAGGVCAPDHSLRYGLLDRHDDILIWGPRLGLGFRKVLPSPVYIHGSYLTGSVSPEFMDNGYHLYRSCSFRVHYTHCNHFHRISLWSRTGSWDGVPRRIFCMAVAEAWVHGVHIKATLTSKTTRADRQFLS